MSRKILVIEKLGIISLIYFLLNIWKFEEAYYLSESKFTRMPSIKSLLARLKKLKRLRFKDFSGTYFDVQKESVMNANDRFYDSHRKNNVFVDFLLKFKNNELVEVALRRVLLGYTVRRVTTYVFLKKLIEKHDKPVVFLPVDNVNFQVYLSNFLTPAGGKYAVPDVIKIFNKLKAAINRISFFIHATRHIFSLPLMRGIFFGNIEPKKFRIGFDIHDTGYTPKPGITWEKPYHEGFLYDGDLFAPSNILHVVRNKLRDERTRKDFKKNRIPYAEFGNVKIPFKYFVKRIILDFYPKTFISGLRNLFSRSDTSILMLPSIIIANYIIANEIFYSYYNVKVFIARDECGANHIIRTIILNEKGGKTVGFMHGDDSLPTCANSYISFDYYSIWGEFHKKLHQKSLRYSKNIEIIGAGIYGLDNTYKFLADKIPEKYEKLKKKYKIITVFGSSFDPDLFITEELTLYFFKTVLSLLKKYDDIFIVIKPKHNEFKDKKFQEVTRGKDRVCIEHDFNAYELIAISDLLICINCSTVGLEGLMAGKKVLYFDVTNFEEHPYRKYDKHLVSVTPEDLYKNVDWVLEGNYLSEEELERIRAEHGLKFDGKTVERFKNIIRKALLSID